MRTKTLKAYGIGNLFRRIQRLKRDDKILFGIATVFLMLILCFIYFINMIFNGLERISKATQPVLEKTSSHCTPFKDFEQAFDRLDVVIEENKRRRREDFQQAIKEFQQGYKQAQDNFYNNQKGKRNIQKGAQK